MSPAQGGGGVPPGPGDGGGGFPPVCGGGPAALGETNGPVAMNAGYHKKVHVPGSEPASADFRSRR